MHSLKSKGAFLLCLSLLGVTFVLALGIGASGLSWYDLFGLFWLKPESDVTITVQTILLQIRLPRIIVAALCGGALAAAGVASQGLFRNALASPSVLGTESGGSLGAVLLFFFGPEITHIFAMPLASAAGALLTMLLVLRLAGNVRGTPLEVLLLTGLALSTWFSAIVSLVISLSLEDYQKAGAIMHWILGGFSGKGWEHVWMALIPTCLGIGLMLRLAPRFDVLSLGEDIARSLSLDLAHTRRLTIVTIALLVGGAMASAGALPFVGLVVPHLTRKLFGPSHLKLTLLSVINGMTLTILADLMARTVRAPNEMEVGIITALIGAPFFLWQLAQRPREVIRGST